MEPEQLLKWHASNDIWAADIMDIPVEHALAETSVPPHLCIVLDDFADVFAELRGLHPHQQYDHAVTLINSTCPANSWPYRYLPVQKDKIERQVCEMLHSRIIAHSMSPFSAAVLLVKKKDHTWRFCVDYRRLNDITIKTSSLCRSSMSCSTSFPVLLLLQAGPLCGISLNSDEESRRGKDGFQDATWAHSLSCHAIWLDRCPDICNCFS